MIDLEDIRLAVYRSFATTGRPPSTAALAEQLGATDDELHRGFSELAEARHVVLDATGAIVMAHPFSAIPLGFSVMGRATLWWGGCSWDSFAIPHLLADEPEVLVATRCPGCGTAGAWVVTRHEPPDSEWVAHFLVPAAQMWDDVVHTCGNQRLFCSERCLKEWLGRNDHPLGYLTDLSTVWRLASHWYDGRLDRGYQRRDPSAAAEYLQAVGLRGPFWGS